MKENKYEMPVGLAFQLSMDEKAMEKFAALTTDEKDQVLDAARNVNSKEEMREIVTNLAKNKSGVF